MKVEIRNIGKIASADIELSGLTAIIGENDRGKSTAGKSLYALFRSLDEVEDRIFEAQIHHVVESLRLPYNPRWRLVLEKSCFDGLMTPSRDEILERLEHYRPQAPYSVAGRWRKDVDESGDLADRIAEEVDRVRRLPRNELLHAAVTQTFNDCFDGQFLPNYIGFTEPSSLNVRGYDSDLFISWHETGGKLDFNGRTGRNAWFIGTPLVLDAMSASPRFGTRGMILDPIHNELVRRLRKGSRGAFVSRQLVMDELRPALELLQENQTAPFGRDEEGRFALEMAGQKSPLRAANLSMGLKVFSVLRLMLETNVLQSGDVVILDEPENHLHPDHQELFARLIVKIQRLCNLRLLVTTHSPYFLQALELYSRQEKHESAEAQPLKVYQPEISDKLGRVTFEDISGDTSAMYRKFAMAMREMDILRREVDGYDH